MDLRHLLDDSSRSAAIAQSPTGHGISLGETVNVNGTLLHAGQADDGHMLLFISKLRIDLVRHNKNVMFFDNFRNGFQIRLLHDGTGRVVRERKDQHFCLVRDRCFQFLCSQAEFILRLQINDHRRCSCQDRTGLIGYITGLGDQHFVSRITHGTQSDVDSLGTTDRYQHFVLPVIGYTLFSLDRVADLLTQILQTCIGGVKGSSLFQGIDALIPDVPGSVEVRFSHTERDCILHLTYNIKKFADTRWFDIHYFIS